MPIVGALPVTLQNGTTADATEVMADLNKIRDDVNANAAANGANSDITSLSGLTTPLSLAQGGTPVYSGGTSTGTANAQVLASPSPSGFSKTAGRTVTWIAGATLTNTTAMTLNVNSTGATNVFKPSASGPIALTGGEVVAGNEHIAIFDGTQYQLIASGAAVGGTDYQAFTDTAGGTWTRPTNYTAKSRTLVQAWGAGGGGGENASGGGGGGGAYVEAWFLTSALTSTVAVSPGTGGAVHTVGGNSTFGAFLTAYGGGGGADAANGGGGGGGGQAGAGFSSSTTAGQLGGNPRPELPGGTPDKLGAGGAAGTSGVAGAGNVGGGGGGGGGGTAGSGGQGGQTTYGGGGGGGGGTGSGGAGGASTYGGGGGGAKATNGGSSQFGGTGGTGGGTAPTAPGGGGGRNVAGARGEVRVTTFI